MTIDEVKALLKSLSKAKSMMYIRKRQLDFYREHPDLIKIMNYSSTMVSSSDNVSIVERTAMKLEDYEEKYLKACEKMFDIENKVTECLEYLDETEIKLVVDRFIDDMPMFKLCNKYYYTPQSLKDKYTKIYRKVAINTNRNVNKLYKNDD